MKNTPFLVGQKFIFLEN